MTQQKTLIRPVQKASPGAEGTLRRWRTEAALRTLDRRLKRAHEWLPLLAAAGAEERGAAADAPAKVLAGLQRRRVELLGELRRMREDRVGEPHRRPGGPPGVPGIPGLPDLMPDREKLGEGLLIERMREDLGRREVAPPVQDDGTTPPQPWTATLWASEFLTYPDLRWSDDGASFSAEWWPFDAAADVSRGIVATKGFVDVPPPPFYKPWEDPHHAQLARTAALRFDIPAPQCDACVFYDARPTLALNQWFDAPDRYFVMTALLCVQPDAAAAEPTGLEDFDWVEPSITQTESTAPRIASAPVTGSYLVARGKGSRVYLGMHWNLSLSDGQGGTRGGWDNLILFPPPGSDTWGLRVTVTPAT